MTVSAVIPAGGLGTRFSKDIKKQYFQICSKPVLYYTLKRLKSAYNFDEFIIGAAKEEFEYIAKIALEVGIYNYKMVSGGNERIHTVLNALNEATSEYVAVHDAVRPFVSDDVVQNTINTAKENGASACGMFSRDTVKYSENGFIIRTLDRNNIFLAHTPQVFKRTELIDAIQKSLRNNTLATDESGSAESAGYKVKTVLSNPDNIKITEYGDLALAEILVKKYFD